MADFDAIFKAYDIRGTVPDQLDVDGARAIGAGFGRFVRDHPDGGRTVVVAHDMRPSGPDMVAAFTEGCTSQGVSVELVGLASTDMMYFASGSRNQPGAVFTASHNPAQYNGIKMCLAGAMPLGADTGMGEIKALAEQFVAEGIEPQGEPGTVTEIELLDDFAQHCLSFVDVASLSPLKIIADTANGMGGLVVPAVFQHLPFDLEIMYPELDGTFPNHPADPIQPENQRDLIARVLETGADLGLAFDGDADRVFLVDEKGQGVSGSLTTALVAKGLLAKTPGATILHNLICSKSVPEVVAEGHGTAVRTQVGHSYIKQVMADSGALFAGEHSGHYYFRDNYRADSGLIASLIILEMVSAAGVPLSELVAPVDRYAASGEINTKVDDTDVVIEKVATHYADADQDRLDGLTVDFGDWWFNLRASNTEPLLRLNLEAATPAECDARVAEVRSLFA
ncbi:MAG: phosphomannomutase/phosphoglucomutase [Acidimicrobiales bacterium]|nr:phosphomannomutase/phosphoglucomutase [Acidimicrobiales bacterium]